MIPEPGYYWVKFKDGRVTIAKVSEYYFEMIASDEIFDFKYYNEEGTEWYKIIPPIKEKIMNKYLIFSHDSDSDHWDSWNKLCTIEGENSKEALGEYMKILDKEYEGIKLTESNLKYHFPYLFKQDEGISFKDYTWFSTEDSYCIWNPDLDCMPQ